MTKKLETKETAERGPNCQRRLVRLYAFQPKGHGELSFFVAAETEEKARQSVDAYIAAHKGKDDGHYVGDYNTDGWGSDYYMVTVAEIGQVVTNDND